MIVWGHGLEHYQDIVAMVQATTPSVRIWFQKLLPVDNIGQFIDKLYQDDIARVGAGHIRAKTTYLQQVGRKIGVGVLFDPTPAMTTYGEGRWKIVGNKHVVDLKWAIRRAFNPNPNGNPKRDSHGVFSHHHVVHMSDTAEGVNPAKWIRGG